MNDKEYYAAIEAAGHLLRRDERGEVDFFALDSGHHNGPGCELCHDTWCQHCRDSIEPCSVGVIDSTCTVVEDTKALPMTANVELCGVPSGTSERAPGSTAETTEGKQ